MSKFPPSLDVFFSFGGIFTAKQVEVAESPTHRRLVSARAVQTPPSDETLPKVFIKKPCYNNPLPDFRFFFRKGGVDAGGSLWWVACS